MSTKISTPGPALADLPPDIDVLVDAPTKTVAESAVKGNDSTTPSNLPNTANEDEISRNIAYKHSHFRAHPLGFLNEIKMMYSGTDWRSYDNPIGQPIYYKGFTENMKDMILNSPLVQRQIAQLADKRTHVEDETKLFESEAHREKRRSDIEMNLQEVAAKMADGMICKFESKPFIKVCQSISCLESSRVYSLLTISVGSILFGSSSVIKNLSSRSSCFQRRSSPTYQHCQKSSRTKPISCVSTLSSFTYRLRSHCK